jgi:cytidylate kinase
MPRTVEALVEHQARQWQLGRQERKAEPLRPVVTVSHMPGAGGHELVARLREELRLDVFDREIVHQIAETTHLSERVVDALDERAQEGLAEWLAGVASHDYLSTVEYRYQLTRVLGAIARHGGAIIIGRGAHLVLHQGEALRVLAVAPLEARVERVMRREGISEPEARRRIKRLESDRRAFLLKHFHAEFGDPTQFDLVVNTATLGMKAASAAVCAALAARAH